MADGPESGPRPPTRRRFCSAALGGAGAAFVATAAYPAVEFLGAAARLARARAEEVSEVVLGGAAAMPAGTARMFRLGPEPGLLIHLPDAGFVAFAAFCTHLNCIVRYDAERRRILCPCHDGVFDERTGANLEGPPPRPLRSFVVTVLGEDLRISREAT
jgi:Rieske Fe-S protein